MAEVVSVETEKPVVKTMTVTLTKDEVTFVKAALATAYRADDSVYYQALTPRRVYRALITAEQKGN